MDRYNEFDQFQILTPLVAAGMNDVITAILDNSL